MKKKLALLMVAMTMQPALAQEADDNALVAQAIPYPAPGLIECGKALEQGNILKTDATGALHIAIAGYYFVISVDEKEMRCRMYGHVEPLKSLP